jgi:hypothetical protein
MANVIQHTSPIVAGPHITCLPRTPVFEHADEARQKSVGAGLRREQATAVPGDDVVAFLKSACRRMVLEGMLMRELSQMLGDRSYVCADFLAVHCHNEQRRTECGAARNGPSPGGAQLHTRRDPAFRG